MKFSMCNEMYEHWPFEKICDFIAEAGFDGIEIAPFTLASDAGKVGPEQRRQIVQAAKNAGLEITGLHWLLAKTEGYHLTTPDDAVRERTFAYFQELIRLCADVGGKVMVLGSPLQRNLAPDVSLDAVLKNVVDFFQRLVPDLERAGVVLALEPLAPSETNFLTKADEAVDLAKRIGAPEQVAIILDCKAMCGGETLTIPEVIRKHRGEFVHFHANDPNLQGPGFGDLDFVPIFQALEDVNYTGWVSVETFDYSPGVEHLTLESIQYMKKAYMESKK